MMEVDRRGTMPKRFPTSGKTAARKPEIPTGPEPEVLKEPVHQILSWTLKDIRHLEAQIKVVDRRIAHEPDARTTRLLTVPGLGPVFAAGILAEIGDITDFPDDNQLAPFAGLTGPPDASDQRVGEPTPLARTGNASRRHDLVEAANSVRRQTPRTRPMINASGPKAPSPPIIGRWC